MARSFLSYVKAAFSARPLGMPVPPNWVGMAGFAIAGMLNPGIWLIGAGAELGYLLYLASNKRFQRAVDSMSAQETSERERIEKMIASLDNDDRRSYQLIAGRCREILRHQQSLGVDTAAQDEALSRLVLIYLQLQVTRKNLRALLQESTTEAELPARIETLRKQLTSQSISPELRNSLEGQLQILEDRLAGRTEASDKLQFVAAELLRIHEQVELAREQSMLTSDPAALTERIDGITASLSQTGRWVRDQQRIIGRMDDIATEPPSLLRSDDEGKIAE